jgi:hypothetical protein
MTTAAPFNAEQRARARVEEHRQQQGNDAAKKEVLPPITAIDAASFVNMTITPRRFVLEPWLREKGLAMVHAKTGVGKTWFALGCAHAIAIGGRFLKWSAPAPLRVVYLDGEMAAQDTQERLRSIGVGGAFNIVSFDLYDGPVPNLASEEGQERLAGVIGPADVVFVDNLSCLTFDDGRSDAESWEIVQAWLLALRRQGKSVVLLHHSGKNGAQRGTSRRGDALDAVIKLDRPADAMIDDGCRFTVTFEKARGYLGASATPFEAQLRDGEWTMADENVDQLMAVADLLCEGRTIRKIADELGLKPTKVHRLKKQALERGLI